MKNRKSPKKKVKKPPIRSLLPKFDRGKHWR